jgi:hypothetical protein
VNSDNRTIQSAISECESHIRWLESAVRALEEDSSPTPFLNVLNRLEQLGAISDISKWQEFRNIRNNLAHDYPESQEQTVATLNDLFDNWRGLADMFHQARDYYKAHAE